MKVVVESGKWSRLADVSSNSIQKSYLLGWRNCTIRKLQYIRIAVLSTGTGIALADILPVGDLPDSLDVVGANILILEVVGVLPDVNSEQRDKAGRSLERILVSTGGDLNRIVIISRQKTNAEILSLRAVSEPAPSGSLDTG